MYQHVYHHGDTYLKASQMKRSMTSREMKFKKKAANVSGLQLADLLAHPITRDVLKAYRRCEDHGGPFAQRIAQLIEPKYHRGPRGYINGFGRKFLG
jgi:hypothetical protein